MLRLSRRFVLVTAVFASGAQAQPRDAEEEAVRAVLLGRFDRPEARLTVEPVTTQGALAVAGWSQGEMGGRALLERRDGQWALLLCAGDALLQPDMLHHAGLSEADAQRMAARVVAAEARLPAGRRELFARFDGIVRVDNAARPHP